MKRKMAVVLSIMMVFASVMGGLVAPVFAEGHNNDEYRIAGDNRYLTAYEIAKYNDPNPETVIIVRGDGPTDAPNVVDGLTASGLAGVENAQILLVQQDRIPDSTHAALESLNPTNAIIVGGHLAVSENVRAELEGLGLNVSRLAGLGRAETAGAVAEHMGAAKDNTAIIVNGYAEPDALVAGPLAHQGHPILMVNNAQSRIPKSTLAAIEDLGIENLVIVGGTSVVSEDLEAELEAIEGVTVAVRFGGANRVATSLLLAEFAAFDDYQWASLVNGWKYVDAVAASTLGAPVVYYNDNQGISQAIADLLGTKTGLKAIGGVNTIPQAILDAAIEALMDKVHVALEAEEIAVGDDLVVNMMNHSSEDIVFGSSEAENYVQYRYWNAEDGVWGSWYAGEDIHNMTVAAETSFEIVRDPVTETGDQQIQVRVYQDGYPLIDDEVVEFTAKLAEGMAYVYDADGDYVSRHDTIQGAINAETTEENYTVHVTAGTYEEADQIVINKNLSIVGADRDTTIIKPAQNTGSDGDARGWFLVEAGNEFNLSNVTLDGEGMNVHQAIRSHGSGTINNNHIKNIRYAQHVGLGMVGMDGSDMTFSNNTFINIERIGMMAFGTGTNAEIIGNTYTGKGEGNYVDYGIEIGGGAAATITGNTITDAGPSTSDDFSSAAISVTSLYAAPGEASSAVITGNTLINNEIGIIAGYGADAPDVVIANSNNIAGNSWGIESSTEVPVDATDNWWGHESGPGGEGPGEGDVVSENVIFEPWADSPF